MEEGDKMISVIMSTYHETEEQLRGAIESILSQTYKGFEFLILLDDPQNSLHRKIIESYGKQDTRIRFYINEKNIGLTNTLNKALKFVKGDYVARMDADDISLSTRLEKQLNYLKSNDFDLIGGITQIVDDKGNDIYSIQKVPTDPNKIKKALRYGQCIAHPTWLGKKEVFDSLSGYRNIPLCEDYDFTLRAQLKGYRISNLNEVVLKYRMTENSISRNNLYQQYLFMKYITSNFSKGVIVNIDDAKKYVEKHDNQRKSQKYLKANVLFNTTLNHLNNKEWSSFLISGIQLTFTSIDYLDKIRRFLMLSLNS